ncbi:DUF6062 family protein [Candidatus Caldatribacterium sp. SIUC1]|uniref:DUF6062 family protein n=1 Tax=Candidatus Caldatribacterium sp. SIUC1 TaxID=3418365 RepID=UPI003F68C4BC
MDQTFFKLQEALTRPGCFLCRLEEDHGRRFLEGLFYEFVNDSAVRHKLLAGGLCSDHARMLFTLRPSILGIAIVLQNLLQRYLDGGKRPDLAHCLVCQNSREHLQRLVHLLHTRWESLRNSWGEETFLCTRHLEEFSGAFRLELEGVVRQKLSGILGRLSCLIEKFDYHNTSLPITPQEARSWQEALEFFAGCKLQRD